MGRLEQPLAALQETKSPPQSPGGLQRIRFSATLEWAHGELPLPNGQVSLRSLNFAARRFFLEPAAPPRGRTISPEYSQRPPSARHHPIAEYASHVAIMAGHKPLLTALFPTLFQVFMVCGLERPSNDELTTKLIIAQVVDSVEGARS